MNSFSFLRMISKANAVIVLLFLISVPLAITYLYKDISEPLKKKLATENLKNTQTTPTPLFTPGALFELKNSTVLVKSNEIVVKPILIGSEGQHYLSLMPTRYPDLFRNQYIIPTELYDSVNDKNFLLITSNSDKSGWYQPYYFVIVDPEKGKVVYTPPQEFGNNDQSVEFINGSVLELSMSNVFVYDRCGNCAVNVLEFVSYDPILGKFVSVNTRYRSYFQKRIEYFNKILKEKSCTYKGKQDTLNELYSIYGEEATCFEGYPEQDNLLFTIGEFIQLKLKLEQIVSGNLNTLVTY